MERCDSYSYPNTASREKEFLELLQANGLVYNSSTDKIRVEGLEPMSTPPVASKFYHNGRIYVIIPEDSGNDLVIVRNARRALGEVARLF